MPKLSGEATIGLLFEVVVGILDRLHFREPLFIWGLFAVGLLLIGDGIVRGDWANEISDPRVKRQRRFLYGGLAAICLFAFGCWIFVRLRERKPDQATASPRPAPNAQLANDHASPAIGPSHTATSALVTPEKERKRQAVPVRKSSAPMQPSVSTSGDKSPAIGSVSQGAGSAFSVNQRGGITAGTLIVNAPPPPQITWTQQSLASGINLWTGVPHWTIGGHSDATKKEDDRMAALANNPGALVTLSLSDSWSGAAFAAYCDRPCETTDAQFAGSLTSIRKVKHDENSVAIEFLAPGLLSAQVPVKWEIRSMDSDPIRIEKVEAVKIKLGP
jgi:hypothetical protein